MISVEVKYFYTLLLSGGDKKLSYAHNKKKSKSQKHLERMTGLLNSIATVPNDFPYVESDVKKVVLPKDNTVYITFNKTKKPLGDIKITDHAVYRYKQRLSAKNDAEAKSTLKNLLVNSKCIGLVTDNEGKESILFAKGKNGVYLAPDLSEIKTVIRHETVTFEPIKTKLFKLHERELNKLNRLEKSKANQLEELKLQTNIEIAQLEYDIYKSKSQANKQSYISRIEAIKQSIKEYELDLKNIKDTKRQLSKSIVSVC